jgi:hypothetical protein
MMVRLGIACTLGLVMLACARTSRSGMTRGPTAGAPEGTSRDSQVVETIPLHRFESAPTNDPEIRRMSDGSLLVVFNCMPPCSTPDARDGPPALGTYEHFDSEMQRAIGVDVVWEDREFFRISKPKADTVDKLREFVAGYHARKSDK